MVTKNTQGIRKRGRRRIFATALMLAACTFLFHTGVLSEVAHYLSTADTWLTNKYSRHTSGRVVVLACFFILFLTHFIEAAAWGWFLWREQLVTSFTEGVYFSAASVTTLGYGDVVLVSPWRMLGPLMAITGTLMFGCSTAFLFLVLQEVWAKF